MPSDAKGRERRLFDTGFKAKERFRALLALESEGVPEEEISALYERRHADIAALYREYVRYMNTGNAQKGKQLRLEEAPLMCDVLRRLCAYLGSGISPQWLLEQVLCFLHVDNLQRVRRSGVMVLMHYADTMLSTRTTGGLDAESSNLLLSVIDWNTVRQMSDPQLQLQMPKGVREVREVRYTFLPKRHAQPRDEESRAECADTFSDILSFVAERRDRRLWLAAWWGALKTSLILLLYPRDAEAAGIVPKGKANGGFLTGLSPAIHRVVCDVFILPVLQSPAAGVLADSQADFAFVMRLLRLLVSRSPQGDLHQQVSHGTGADSLLVQQPPACCIASVFLSNLRQASPPWKAVAERPDAAVREMAQILAQLFDHMSVTGRHALDTYVVAAETAAGFFITAQRQHPEFDTTLQLQKDTRRQLLRQWLAVCRRVYGPQTVASAHVGVRDAIAEAVSRALWLQLLIACPLDDDASLWTELRQCVDTAAEQNAANPRRCPAAVCIPATAVAHRGDFTALWLERHWRVVVLSLLRHIIARSGGADSLPRPFPGLCLAAAQPAPSPSSPRRCSAASLTADDFKREGTAASYEPRPAPQPPSHQWFDHVDVLARERLSPGEAAGLWHRLFSALCGGSECAMPIEVHLQRLLAASDAGSDLLYAARSHLLVADERMQQATEAQQLPRHLLASCGRPLGLRPGAAPLPPTAVAALLLPPCLRALRRQGNADFAAAGGPCIALGTLCDLLGAAGGQLGDAALSQACFAVAQALCGADPDNAQVALYRLFPAGGATSLPARHYLTQSHRGALVLAGPVALAAAAELAGPCGIESADPRLTAVRCSAAALQLQAACAMRAQPPDLPLPWPPDWRPSGRAAELVAGGLPRTAQDLLRIAVNALVAGARCSQPPAVAGTSLKGLGIVSLAELSGPGGDEQLVERLICTIGARLTHPAAEVCGAAVAVMSTVICEAATALSSRVRLLGRAVSITASALLSATHNFRLLRRAAACRALILALVDVIGTHHGLHRIRVAAPGGGAGGAPAASVLELCVDTLSYCASSRCSRRWAIPEVREGSGDAPEAIALGEGAAAAAGTAEVPEAERCWWEGVTAPASAVSGTRGADMLSELALSFDRTTSRRSEDARSILGTTSRTAAQAPSDADCVASIQAAAEVALAHVGAYYAVFPVAAHGPALVSSAETLALGPSAAPIHLARSQADHPTEAALLTVAEAPSPAAVAIAARTAEGRYQWELRPLTVRSDSLFPTADPAPPAGQRRSQSGALVGRGRTAALHEAPAGAAEAEDAADPAAGDGADLALTEANALHSCEYIARRRKAPGAWEGRMQEFCERVDAAPAQPEVGWSPPEAAVPPQREPLQGAASEGCSAALDFIVSGPLLEPPLPPVPTVSQPAVPTAFCPTESGPGSSPTAPTLSGLGAATAAAELDDLPERDCLTVAVYYCGKGQHNGQGILGNGQRDTSADFGAFLRGLGWAVALDKHRGFCGGIEYDQQATPEVLYHASATHELVYHVPSMVHPEGADPGAVIEQRRRMLSGDQVHVVWCEDDEYNPNCLGISVRHVVLWIVLHPGQLSGLVRVALHQRAETLALGAAAAAPLVDGALIPGELAAAVTRAAALGTLRALRHHGRLAPGALHARRAHLADAAQRLQRPPATLGALALALASPAQPHQATTTPRAGSPRRRAHFRRDSLQSAPSSGVRSDAAASPPMAVLSLDTTVRH